MDRKIYRSTLSAVFFKKGKKNHLSFKRRLYRYTSTVMLLLFSLLFHPAKEGKQSEICYLVCDPVNWSIIFHLQGAPSIF